jgi:hypothetical protein
MPRESSVGIGVLAIWGLTRGFWVVFGEIVSGDRACPFADNEVPQGLKPLDYLVALWHG